MKDWGKIRIPLENIQSKIGGALLALLKFRNTVLIEDKDVIGVKEVLFFFKEKIPFGHLQLCETMD